VADDAIVRVKLPQLRLLRPRQWGACWLALTLWHELGLDEFWRKRLPASRKGTRWDQVLLVLAAYRLIAPGSEWRLHREWFARGAPADLLGEDAWSRIALCASGRRRATNSTAATTNCLRTSRRYSITWWGVGAICSTPPSTCCCTT